MQIPKKVFAVIVIGILLLLPQWIESLYILNLLIFVGLNIILASTNRLILRTGVWFMGHIAFYAIGAYVALLGTKYLGLNYWLVFPLSGMISGLVALLFGYATSRLSGIPFAILTVAFVEVVRLTIVKVASGRPVSCPAPDPILFFDFSQKDHYYYFVVILTIAIIYLLYLIENSRVARTINAIHENEPLTESLGINCIRYKIAIISFSCACAGLAGAVFAPYVTVVGHTSFNLNASIIILIYVVVGGIGSLWGPILGAMFLTILPELLPGRASMQNIIYAATVLASLFFLPGGLVSLPETIRKKRFVTALQLLKQKITKTPKNIKK